MGDIPLCPDCGFPRTPGQTCLHCQAPSGPGTGLRDRRPAKDAQVRWTTEAAMGPQRRMNRVKRLCVAILLALGAALSLAVAAPLATMWSLAARTGAWPEAPGRVLSSGVVEKAVGNLFTRRETHAPFVRYAYEARGRKYVSERVAVEELTGQGISREIADRFPQGLEVRVRHHPGDPSQSVLLPGIQGRVREKTVAAFALAGLCFLALVFRRIVYIKMGLWVP
ncbi:MAG: DUF3592 domain-containing protein [Proteobacteria bacterium]|nr:DUF3592 domain-containing protein [Pseudomonadota bacterium]